MTIYEAIYAHLGADTDVTDIVGTKIYQTERKQGEDSPAVVFDSIGGESFEEIADGPVGLASTMFQFDCYGTTSKQAESLREVIRLSLQTHRGAKMGGGSGVWVYGCLFTGLSSGFDPDTRDHVRSIDFEVQHEQATS